MQEHTSLTEKFKTLRPVLNEHARRLWAATEALALGRGGISAVAHATGLSRPTIYAGIPEIQTGTVAIPPKRAERVRRPGGGRTQRTTQDPTLLHDLEALVEPTTRGDPQSPLRWTCKSVRKLAAELQTQGHHVSPQLVSELLHAADYSLQGTRKTREGSQHPDRNAQFAHRNARVQAFQRRGQPVISVDAKKKELLGDFKNAGREWHPMGHPPDVRVYDFVDTALGKALPYGVYDIGANLGWVSVGVDHDTAAFAVATIRAWWHQMGAAMYPRAKALLITADSGGSNSVRTRRWKVELQRLADETGLRLAVSHFSPGTSKWNKIEHCMFCHITANWRGRPLLSREVIVSLMGSTTSTTGLRIHAALDAGHYPLGIKVSAAELAAICLERSAFHGEWNYTILPHKRPRTRREGVLRD
ncbi:MAG: ISAzo13 family transposase [Candidatus Tectomicrobia bacterium]|uniref:ISAzo13 family transposase n=1 Tax=Tectimicrobiota bacterium TaxID=2528274 RepID=A0A937W1K9_UNCTE|nr:ISAzo13 family transposase [Candidatus Tectomicrobia bacterium]